MKEKTAVKIVVAIIIVFFGAMIWLTDDAFGTDNWHFSHETGVTLDSIYVHFIKLAAADTTTRSEATVSGFDTTYTFDADLSQCILVLAYYPGMDSAVGTSYYHWKESGTDTAKIITAASNNPGYFYGPTLTGTGTYVVGVYTVDTIDTPTYDTVSGVEVEVKDMTESYLLGKITSSSGYTYFNLDADTFIIVGTDNGIHDWRTDTLVVSAATTHSLKGYQLWQAPTSVADKVCAVSVRVVNSSGEAVENVKVTAYPAKDNLIDSAGNAVSNVIQSDRTNALGYATFECTWSSYLLSGGNVVVNSDGTEGVKWRFDIHTLGVRKNYIVPRQSSATINLTE